MKLLGQSLAESQGLGLEGDTLLYQIGQARTGDSCSKSLKSLDGFGGSLQ